MAVEYNSFFVASLRCVISTVCGDDLAEGAERCDGTDLRGQDCISLGFSSGTLQCASDCTDYDTSMCTGGCGPSDPPLVAILSPSTGPLPGFSTTIQATASDADGIKEVRFFYQYCPESEGFVCRPRQLIGTDDTGPSPYTMPWTFPSCGAAPDNRKFTIIARAEDNCGNWAQAFVDDLVLGNRGC